MSDVNRVTWFDGERPVEGTVYVKPEPQATAAPSVEYGDPRIPDRIWRLVHPEPNTGCWLWSGDQHGRGRYGRTYLRAVTTSRSAHIVTWTALAGPVPPGLEVDHLCRIRLCVNPAHLEPVTHEENVRRGIVGEVNGQRMRELASERTRCDAGHEYTPENTRVRIRNGRTSRICLECDRVHGRAKHARLLADPARRAALRERQNREQRERRARRTA